MLNLLLIEKNYLRRSNNCNTQCWYTQTSRIKMMLNETISTGVLLRLSASINWN